MDNRSDQVYRALASSFADMYGRQLIAEHPQLLQRNVTVVTPRADARIRQIKPAPKRTGRRIFTLILAATLVVAVAVSIPTLFMRGKGGGSVAEEPAPSLEFEADDQQSAASEAAGGGLIELKFTLPADFEELNRRLDNGQSVYTLHSETYGDVVLTIEAPENSTMDLSAMAKQTYKGQEFSYSFTDDYNLVAFEHAGLFYTISSTVNKNAVILLLEAVLDA